MGEGEAGHGHCAHHSGMWLEGDFRATVRCCWCGANGLAPLPDAADDHGPFAGGAFNEFSVEWPQIGPQCPGLEAGLSVARAANWTFQRHHRGAEFWEARDAEIPLLKDEP